MPTGRRRHGVALSRRELLEAAGLVGAGSLAGCTAILGGEEDAPTDWLYAPSELGDWQAYDFRFAEPAVVFDHEESLNDSSLQRFREHLFVGGQADLGLDPADVEWFLRSIDPFLNHPSVTVTRGSMDADALRSDVETLRSPAFQQADSYRGFDLYDGGSEVAGVDEGTLLWAVVANSFVPLETAIDASDGRVPRVQEHHGAAAAMVDRLLPATFASLQLLAEGDIRGEGYAQTVDGERTTVTSTTVFESADAVPADASSAETWYTDVARERVRDLQHRVDEEVVVGTGWVPTAEVELGLWPFRAVE